MMLDDLDHTVHQTGYELGDCAIGVVHLGFGGFHRAHQALYFDDYMDATGDLRWGIAAVNLRKPEARSFAENKVGGYLIKSISPDGAVALRSVRSHIAFEDWSADAGSAESLLSLLSVHMVTITVTESGYYTDPTGALDATDPIIAAELAGGPNLSVYAYLRKALGQRMATTGAPITICCCDNIRQNGKMLHDNLQTYLALHNDTNLSAWIDGNVTFPCSMVDRITPRTPPGLAEELRARLNCDVTQPIMAETFMQWVLQDKFAGPMPDLTRAGVTVTDDVDPYEETKIRVLNGGHTCLSYLAALNGYNTFDQAMEDPELFAHFWSYETKEVLPALTLDLPFSKAEYLDSIAARFKNAAIADQVSRICADGMTKFPIFIRPTLEGCLQQGIMPEFGLRSIAGWHSFATHVAAGDLPFDYLEPSWALLTTMLNTDDFVMSEQLWGHLPLQYPAFADRMRAAIKDMEQSWPV